MWPLKNLKSHGKTAIRDENSRTRYMLPYACTRTNVVYNFLYVDTFNSYHIKLLWLFQWGKSMDVKACGGVTHNLSQNDRYINGREQELHIISWKNSSFDKLIVLRFTEMLGYAIGLELEFSCWNSTRPLRRWTNCVKDTHAHTYTQTLARTHKHTHVYINLKLSIAYTRGPRFTA